MLHHGLPSPLNSMCRCSHGNMLVLPCNEVHVRNRTGSSRTACAEEKHTYAILGVDQATCEMARRWQAA